MSHEPTAREIEEELAAIRMAEVREKQTKAQVEEFKLKLMEMKSVLKEIQTKKDEKQATTMKEVCLFTIYQCNQHIVH